MAKPDALLRLSGSMALAFPSAGFAQNPSPPPGRDWHGPWFMMHGWGWEFGWAFPLLAMLFMVVACFFIMRLVMRHGSPHIDTTRSALRLLNERFARGEISKEEYEDKRATLARSA